MIVKERVRDIDLFSEEVRQNWVDYSRQWSRSEPFFVMDRDVPHFVCGRYDDVRRIFHARHAFTVEVPKRRGYERYDPDKGVQAITHVDGEAHDRLRRLLQTTFSQARVEALQAGVTQVVDDVLDGVEEKGEFDAVADLSAQLMPRIVLGLLLGLEEVRHGPFRRRHQLSPQTMNIPAGGEYPQEYTDTIDEARRVIDEVIAERERSGWGEDFVGGLLKARAEGADITDDEIFANFFVIGAASATTEATAAAMLMLLCQNPSEFDKLRADVSLVPGAVEESLRLHPAGMFVFARFATHDVEINGALVPAGTPTYPCVSAANIDAEHYPDPLRFDITRQPARILTFGAGAHFCLGALLARMVLQTSLRRIIDRFHVLEFIDSDYEPTYHGQLGELKPVNMPMRVLSRRTSGRPSGSATR